MINNLHDEYILLEKISDITNEEIKKEFIENYIEHHSKKNILLNKILDLFIIVIYDNDIWKNILNNEQYVLLQKNNGYILGYMLFEDYYKFSRINYIKIIDGRSKNIDVIKIIIDKYNKKISEIKNYDYFLLYDDINIEKHYLYTNILPLEITEDNYEYWKIYFEKKYFITNGCDMCSFINFNAINIKILRWDKCFCELYQIGNISLHDFYNLMMCV